MASRVTLLSAEAGYGKTTLLADFGSRTARRSIWYRLDATDRDWVTLVNYLVWSVREVLPTFGDGPTGVLAQVTAGDVPRDVVVSRLMADLAVLGEAPTTLILDDFHLVDGSKDVADFVQSLVRDAPPSMRFIIAGRQRPSLPMGRLASSGDLAELTPEDLRFSRDEIAELFAEIYGQPLEFDVLVEVDQRTRGWAASLQLFYSTIRGRPNSDIRSAANALTGTAQRVYEYLAEEVVGSLPDDVRDFLLRAAILDRITVERAAALFWPALGAGEVQHLIEEGDRLSLLHRSARDSDVRQLHPLLRDFLRRDLLGHLGAEAIREMHERVADAIRVGDPLTAAHHLLEAGRKSEAMDLLGDSVLVAVGSGRWGTASDLIDRLGSVVPVPAVITIQARRLLDEGRAETAAAIMRDIDVTGEPPDVRAAFWQTVATLAWHTSDLELERRALDTLVSDAELPGSAREIARLFGSHFPHGSPIHLDELAARLERLGAGQTRDGHHYYAAISFHNAATAAIGSGSFSKGIALADAALTSFERLDAASIAIPAALVAKGTCLLELGQAEAGIQQIEAALGADRLTSDVPAEAAVVFATIGLHDRVPQLTARVRSLESQGHTDPAAEALTQMARAMTELPERPSLAVGYLSDEIAEPAVPTGLDLSRQVILASALLVLGEEGEAIRISRNVLSRAETIGARRVAVRAGLLAAIGQHDQATLRQSVKQAATASDLALPEVAQPLINVVQLISDMPELRASIERWPARWLPVLRKQLTGDQPTARAAAELLDMHGESSDVALLRAFAKTYRRRGRLTSGLGRALARRTSPLLRIDDLGPAKLKIGQRVAEIGSIRRKAAALLMYLVTRTNLTATREQVMDDLWPEADPESAGNSLNQTLHFLRRDIDPWFEDDVSADYILFQGDLVWLDGELVSVASRDFLERTRQLLSQEVVAASARDHVRSYRGQFSPEFEYEEWAITWRTRVHASFLEFAHVAMDALTKRGDLANARDIAIDVLGVDRTATDIEQRLIWLYGKLGARSAAMAQYAHYAARERSDGLPVTDFAQLISDG